MRVLQIIDNAIYGGAERHTLFISREFLRHGHEVTLVCPPGPFLREYRLLEREGGKVVVIPEISRHYFNPLKGFDILKFLKAREKLSRLALRERFQLVHSHMHCADYLVASVRDSFKGAVFITTLHNLEALDHFPVYRYIRKPFIKKALKVFDKVFAISQSTAQIAKRYFELPDGKLKVLKNAIDPDALVPTLSPDEVRRRLGLKRSTFMFLTLGEYCRRKNQITILKAVKTLISRGRNNFCVVMAGLDKSGYGRKTLKRAVEKWNLSGHVILAGFWDDPASLLRACDAYLQPSLWDPLPRSLLEAMFFGRPSIASNIPGIRDVITHGQTGWLHEAEDYISLAELMEKVMDRPEEAKEVGNRGKQLIESSHLMKHMYIDIMREVKEVLSSKGIDS